MIFRQVLRRFWKPLAAALAVLLAFAFGRWSAPGPRVVTQVEYRDVTTWDWTAWVRMDQQQVTTAAVVKTETKWRELIV